MTPSRLITGGTAAALLFCTSPVWADDLDDVRAALKTTLPNTEISSVRESVLPGLYELVTGSNLLYVEKSGRYALIGTLYDLQSHVDLTAKRRDELHLALQTDKTVEAPLASIPWDQLPENAAIVENAGAPYKLAVFADVNCPYCRRLAETLKGLPEVETHTYLMSLWGRSIAPTKAVLCAADKAAALHQAFDDTLDTPSAAPCDTDALERTNAFAAEHGIAGTPFLMRADGVTAAGLKSPAALLAWLKEAAQ
ncbi:thiol:disulfide interchange protein DsbC [Iodidimonas gelatinilytica]|uniref:Thiol:disulfide interchange protein n=1 Tax=Iodidimonas gelatinilytica TaxID=1236966 RepID=A0A5A7MTH2_9PROT|nr:DsbC family protein [Iodidimonas gelatinilytica]GEQ99210.1 thiol:disulfide interchange protein DsbC [Iodidimonas gelatinilytica]